MSQHVHTAPELPSLATRDFWALSWPERHRAFRELRETTPIAFVDDPDPHGADFYAITRHADICEITRNPTVWSSAKGVFSVRDLPEQFLEFFGSLIVLDDPRHVRLRRIVSAAFSPRALEGTMDVVEEIAEDVVAAVEHRVGTFDFVDEVARPFPLRVICRMMGIPDHCYPEIAEHTMAMTSGGDRRVIGDRDPTEAMLGGGAAMAEIVEDLASQRLAHRQDDIISTLVHASVDGESLTPAEIASFFILLVAAGSDTTQTSLSHGVIALDEFPDEKRRWLDDIDGLTPTAVEEIVRYASPVIYMRRTCTQTTTVGDQRFEPGDKVVMLYLSANRDPDVFADPDRLDLGRSPNESIAFGSPGPHYCLGAHLARRELSVMFSKLLTRVPSLSVVGPHVALRSMFVNGVVHLPVEIADNAR